MQKYTLTVLVNEKVSEADRTATLDALKKHFSTLIKEDIWGMRSLSYEIKHANKAFYAFYEFEAEPTAVITLDKNIRLNEDIIRYLIVKVKEVKAKQSLRSDDLKKETKKAEAGKEKVEAEVKVEEAPAEAKKESKTKRVIKTKAKKE